MPRKTCDSCAVNREIVVLSESHHRSHYRGRDVYLCYTCQKKVAENIPIPLDRSIAENDRQRRERESAEGDFRKREAKVMAWFKRNPEVWDEFVRLSDDMRRVRRYSSPWLVMNVIRWNSLIQTDGEDYKISNDIIAFASRRYMRSHPDRRRFFAIKPMKGEDFNLTKRECGFDSNTETDGKVPA